MTAVLLSAGVAGRLGDRAPHGCKAMLEVNGRTMLDWWRDWFGEEPLLVVRSEHVKALPSDAFYTICDEGGGPGRALAAALPHCGHEPVVVAYADTWIGHRDRIPEGTDWCGVAAAKGGRKWYVLESGLLAYRWVDLDEVAVVGIGLFNFGQRWLLDAALNTILDLTHPGVEVGLDDVSNDMNLRHVPVIGWQDVGDLEALRRFAA